MKSVEPLNASPSTTFLCHYSYKLTLPGHILCGQAKETKTSNDLYELYVKVISAIGAVLLSKQVSAKTVICFVFGRGSKHLNILTSFWISVDKPG